MTAQLCPKCNGQGIVAKPPWIPGDVHQWNSGGVAPYRCNLCNGQKVIAEPAPPVIEEEAPVTETEPTETPDETPVEVPAVTGQRADEEGW